MFYKISLHFQSDNDFTHVPYNGILIALRILRWPRWVSGLLDGVSLEFQSNEPNDAWVDGDSRVPNIIEGPLHCHPYGRLQRRAAHPFWSRPPRNHNFPIIFAFNQEDAAANAGQSLTATQTFA